MGGLLGHEDNDEDEEQMLREERIIQMMRRRQRDRHRNRDRDYGFPKAEKGITQKVQFINCFGLKALKLLPEMDKNQCICVLDMTAAFSQISITFELIIE